MLAVVEPEPVALEGVGRAAQARAHLDERHLRARLGAVERGGDPGEAPADHGHAAAHRRAPARLRIVTHVFSHGGSDTPWSSTTSGLRSMRSRIRR